MCIDKINKQIDHLVSQYEAGALGTPEAPKKSGSIYEMFWRGYYGWVTPTEVRNTFSYPSVKAGKMCAKADLNRATLSAGSSKVDKVELETLMACAKDTDYHYDDRVDAALDVIKIFVKAGDSRAALEWVGISKEILKGDM